MIYHKLEDAWKFIEKQSAPLLWKLRNYYKVSKPFTGLKIYHNIPLTLETLCKVEVLIQAGAEVVVSNTDPLEAATFDISKKFLMDVGIEYRAKKFADKNEFDLYLDCWAGLSLLPPPRLGTVELTRSGILKYQEMDLTYPVISVDDSRLKELETFHGTGDGFVRAFLQLTGESVAGQTFAIFGYGKVGQGVAHWLRHYDAHCVIFDVCKNARLRAKSRGFKGFDPYEVSIEEELEIASYVVSASGKRNVFASFPHLKEVLRRKTICNIGSNDEVSDVKHEMKVLANGNPINFTLHDPTAMKFLDPVFVAHNLGAQLLLAKGYHNGLHLYPRRLDDAIIAAWQEEHQGAGWKFEESTQMGL